MSIYFTEKNHLNDISFSLFAEALKFETVEKLPQEILSHVEICSDCKQQILALTDIISKLEYSSEFSKKRGDIGQKRSYSDFSFFLKIAAIFIVGLAIGLTMYFTRVIKTEPPIAVIRDSVKMHIAANHDSSKQNSKENKQNNFHIKPSLIEDQNNYSYAANFEPSPLFESIIGESSRTDEIKILSPANKQEFRINTDIKIEWKTTEELLLTLKVLNNRENLIFSITTRGNSVLFNKKPDPGIYYWKLETEDDLLFIGKFLISNTD